MEYTTYAFVCIYAKCNMYMNRESAYAYTTLQTGWHYINMQINENWDGGCMYKKIVGDMDVYSW